MADDRYNVDLVVTNLTGFLRAIATAERSVGTIGRAAARVTRDFAKMGDKVTKEQARIASESQKTAQAAYRSASRQADGYKRVASALERIAKAQTTEAQLEKRLAIERERTAQVRARSAAASIQARSKQIISTNKLIALDKKLASQAANTGKKVEESASKWDKFKSSFSESLAGASKFFGAVGAGLSKIAGLASAVLTPAIKGIGLAFRAITAPIRLALGTIVNFISRVAAVASGVLIRDVIFGLIQGFRQLKDAILQTSISFQTLEIRLQNLISREVRLVDQTLTFADSLDVSSRAASGLLDWIRRLSLTVPFDVKVIANTQAYGMAMGFTAVEAQNLTDAILNYTAGMGLSNEVTERIIFNFGQMKAAGKVTATEMRDLARGAFFPLTKVLDEAGRNLGIAEDQLANFRVEAREGKVDVDEFFKAFQRVVAQDFPEAVERMGQTFEGARTRLSNLIKTVVGLEVLGPIISKAGRALSDFVDRLRTPELLTRAKLIGQTLSRGFDILAKTVSQYLTPALSKLWKSLGFTGVSATGKIARAIAFVIIALRELVKWVSRVIVNIATRFSTGMDNLGESAYDWGYRIISFFAQGMAAALKLVTLVINALARLIGSLLRPSSPPKALPDLPKWGMGAMVEYLKGFLLADYDALEGIQGPLLEALKILEDTGEIAVGQAGKIFANLSKAIAKAISGEEIEEGLFRQLSRAAGPFGEEIAKLARLHFELADAVEKLKAAEEALAAAREREQKTRVDLNLKIREYNKLLRAGADKATLKTRLAEVRAQEAAAKSATEQRKSSEDAVESAQDYVDELREAVELQERLIAQILKLTREQILSISVTGGLGGAGEGIKDLAKEIESSVEDLIGGFGGVEEDFNNLLDRIFADAERAFAMFAQSVGGLTAAFDPLTKEGGVLEQLKLALDNLAIVIGETDWAGEGERLGGTFEEAGARVDTALTESGTVINEYFRKWGIGTSESGIGWDLLNKSIEIGSSGIAGSISALTPIITGFTGSFSLIDEIWKKKTQFVQEQTEKFGEGWRTQLIRIGAWIVAAIATLLAGGFGYMLGFIEGVLLLIKEKYPDFWQAASDLFGNFFQGIFDAYDQFILKWQPVWDNFVEFIEDPLTPIVENLTQVYQENADMLSRTLNPAIEWTTEHVVKPMENAFKWLGSAIENVVEWVQNLATAIGTLNLSKIAKLLGWKIPGTNTGTTGTGNTGTTGTGNTGTTGTGNTGLSPDVFLELGTTLGGSGVLATTFPAFAPVAQEPVSAASILNINFGPTTIVDQMTQAEFEARVKYIVMQEMGA